MTDEGMKPIEFKLCSQGIHSIPSILIDSDGKKYNMNTSRCHQCFMDFIRSNVINDDNDEDEDEDDRADRIHARGLGY